MTSEHRFRVDLLLTPADVFIEYTSRKNPVSEEMARALAQHLQRGKTGYRIIELCGKNPERIVEEWRPEKPV